MHTLFRERSGTECVDCLAAGCFIARIGAWLSDFHSLYTSLTCSGYDGFLGVHVVRAVVGRGEEKQPLLMM